MQKPRLEHAWIVKLRQIMSKVWWYGGVAYPSRTAAKEGLEGDYLAITGDGLLELLFEVKSWVGDGQLRYHNLYHNTSEGKDGYPSMFGRRFHVLGIKQNHVMTFPELLRLLGYHIDQENAKWSKGN